MEFTLPHLLTNTAARIPDTEALRMDGQVISYAELEASSNRLAYALMEAGVTRGDRVGLYVHKSFASVIGVFGIMKAGAAYVPLDPNAPVKRLAYITRDCGIHVLVTAANKAGKLKEFVAEDAPLKHVILTDDPDEKQTASLAWPEGVRRLSGSDLERFDGSAPPPVAAIETDLAYILYTSGSTGTPKGVMISHRTIFTFVRWCRDTFRLTEKDRVTSHAPLHFDLSTFDIYASVQAGATIVLVGEMLSSIPMKLAALWAREKVTVTYMVPSILSFMVNYGKLDAHDLSSLRMILFAGEVFPIKYLRRLVRAIPNADYYNLYGPTETNVCTYYQVTSDDVAEDRTEPVPIGRACANMEAFALTDEGGKVESPGVEGELCIRGSCVAQGYWGDREKTARSFVQNPLHALFPDPVYRTGDIVTLAPDLQNWIYVGRRDHMIKSRGYRIELSEIEAAFYRHDQVKEAVVVAVPDDILGNRILAFAVLAENSGVEIKDLLSFCAQHVPKYMVPERIELCDVLPKTSSGKVDRATLAARAKGN